MNDRVVFIVSRNSPSDYRRVLWRVSLEDAKKICSDDRTSGRNFMLCFDKPDAECDRYIKDDGRFADALAEHNVAVLDSHELAA